MNEKKLRIVFWSDHEGKLPLEFNGLTHRIINKAVNHAYLTELEPLKIASTDQPQTLGEEDNDPRIEYTFHINFDVCTPDYNDRLVCLIHFLKTYLHEQFDKYNHTFTCSIFIAAKDFFKVNFVSAQMQFPTEKIAFLNIIERSTPLIHREHSVMRDERNIMQRYYQQHQHFPMLTDFEHDRRQMIVRFPFSETILNRENVNEVVDSVITMTVRYRSIRRMLVTLRRVEGHVNNLSNQFGLELYFHLSSPPVIRRIRLYNNNNDAEKKKVNLLTKYGDRYTTWDRHQKYLAGEINESPIFKVVLMHISLDDCCTLLSRLSATTDQQLQFRTLTHPRIFPFYRYVGSPLTNCQVDFEGNFKIMYMFEALLSRGAVVKDHLLVSEEVRNRFVKTVCQAYREDKSVCLEVLERLLAEIDEHLDIQSPEMIFSRLITQVRRNAETMRQLHEANAKEGYVRVRKVVITPTRTLFVAPELLMGNRVLRMNPDEYPTEKFLRVVFRDDDSSSVHGNSVGDALINKFIGQRLRQGIYVAGLHFNYFGSSNSQLRDNGCYFINATVKEIEEFRIQLGSFKIQSAPKMMSRLGQCFTQARETSMALDRKMYADDYDYCGGADSNGEPYTFSDGVGRISYKKAKELSQELGLEECVPSCFQIRFRGYKGVLAVDTSLDALREWGSKHGVKDHTDIKKQDYWLDLAIKFRPSQKKFAAKRDKQKLEIVKYSSPVSISLNRPVINILDQVSALQSYTSHQRICNRIHHMMDMHLHSLTRSLMDEQKARNKLSDFPKLILYEQITDLNLTKEPFFRGMVRAAVRSSLKKLRQKLQIPISSSLGRAMFGVVDDSGLLQHGQVFIRFTKNAFLKLPGATAEKVVWKGPVLLTKNPSIVAGDIRMFEAVNIPSLYHLCDVVVFPQHGPRPHTDEMAGSDLDGDEYTVIWDDQMYLDHNEEAFDYTSKSTEDITTSEEELSSLSGEEELIKRAIKRFRKKKAPIASIAFREERDKMADFFVDYIKQDSIGRIANAFLINSDLFGITSDVCMRIADKHMEAVDFPKTGKPPKPLETRWKDDKPPERAERTPDFMEKNNEPTYISSRLNGQLFRRAKQIDDILSLATADDETTVVPLDPLIDVPGCDTPEMLTLANEHYEAYAANIQNIMESYGIRTEGELFSGHYMQLRNRISDKDNDDMSFYNTSNAIETRLFQVFAKFRKKFFETNLTGRVFRYEDVTTIDSNNRGGAKEVFRRICTDPSEEYQKLACAYYKTAYDSMTRKLLSFPWLAWDVLNIVRRTNSVNNPSASARFSFDPLSEKVTQHMNEYIEHRKRPLANFVDRWQRPERTPANEREAWKRVGEYCKHHKGLDHLLFFCVKWAKTNSVFDFPINELHICLLLILFGLNNLPCESVETVPYWLEAPDTDKDECAIIDLTAQHGGLGKKFMIFLEYLASRQFEMLPYINFMEANFDYKSAFYQQQWLPIHNAAVRSFHQIAFTFRFEALPSTNDQRKTFSDNGPTRQVQEGDPFIIEVPSSHQSSVINNNELLDRLCQRSGCDQIVFRPLPQYPGSETIRLYVSMTGTIESINSLRSILSVRPNLNLNNHCRQMSTLMAAAVYERLTAEK